MDTDGRRFMLVTLVCFVCVCMVALSEASTDPGPPTGLQVTKVQDLTITLIWQRPLTTSGTPDNSTLSYIVNYRIASSTTTQRLTVSTESAQIALLPHKRYGIQVQAVRTTNQNVQGAWSQILRVDSLDLVPAKPTYVKVTVVNGLKVTLTWTQPQTTVRGKPDTSKLNYHVTYKNLGTKVKRQIVARTERASLFLRANTRFTIQVRAVKAFNDKVDGPWSKALEVLGNEAKPSKAPSNVRVVSNSSSSIYVTWAQIPLDGRNGVVKGYTVFYRDATNSNWSVQDAKGAFSCKLTGLVPGKKYLVRVAGYTKEGTGPKSAVKSIVVGGQIASTTKKPTTSQDTTTPVYVPTIGKSTSTTKRTTKRTTTPQTTRASTTTKRTTTPQTTRASTTTAHVSTTPGNRIKTAGITQSPDKSTQTSSTTEKNAQGSVSSTAFLPGKHSTPAVALASKGDKEPKDDFFKKIIFIGAPVVGGLLLLAIVIICLLYRRKATRKRKEQIGEIPLKTFKTSKKKKKEEVTRGEGSIRYEPPAAHFGLGDDPESEELQLIPHSPDRPTIIIQQPNGSLPRTTTEEAPLLEQGYSEVLDSLTVAIDSSTDKSNLKQGRTSGLYESIGSLGGLRDKEQPRDAEEDERYVTQDQIAVTRENPQQEVPAQGAPHEYSHLSLEHKKKAPPKGNTYENVRDSLHLYETLSFEDQRAHLHKTPTPSSAEKVNE